MIKIGASVALEESADKGGLPAISWVTQDDTTNNRIAPALQFMMNGTYSKSETYGDWQKRFYTSKRVMFVMKPA